VYLEELLSESRARRGDGAPDHEQRQDDGGPSR